MASPLSQPGLISGLASPVRSTGPTRLELFKTCLDAGCLPGRSNHSPLFTRIVTHAFKYGACFGGSEADIAYAKTVIEKTPFDLPQFALNTYEWFARPENLDTLISFGLDPKAPGLIAQVLHYSNCADSPGSTPNAKWTIINRLLDLGVDTERRGSRFLPAPFAFRRGHDRAANPRALRTAGCPRLITHHPASRPSMKATYNIVNDQLKAWFDARLSDSDYQRVKRACFTYWPGSKVSSQNGIPKLRTS